jgi:hypothetical protein
MNDIILNWKKINKFALNSVVVNGEVKRFISEVDVSKVPIQRTVFRMMRIRAIDWDSPKHTRKEYVYYEEKWNEGTGYKAKNYLNKIIAPVMSHIEGRYNETLTEDVVVTNFDHSTGQETEQLQTQFTELSPFSKTTILYPLF